MSLSDDYYATCPIPKPERRKKTKAREERVESERVAKVRAYVFARERNVCRCCRCRPAESMHELRPRSLRGKVSRSNSVAVCGSGTTGCHGFLQQHRITWDGSHTLGAEATLYFMPKDQGARDWMKLGDRHGMESPVMREMEAD